jgi:hypothetical protein
LEAPQRIVAQLTRKCGRNVHDRRFVNVTSESFERETHRVNPHLGTYNDDLTYAAKNVADLESETFFHSAYREKKEHIQHTRNNWICYNFKRRRIIPTSCAIRSSRYGSHLKSWIVETWREITKEDDNEKLKGGLFIATFDAVNGLECCYARLVNIGRNHGESDDICIAVWEIFGRYVEQTVDSSNFAFRLCAEKMSREIPSSAKDREDPD